MSWAGHVASTGDRKGSYSILVEKPEGKRPLGRPWRRWQLKLKWIFQTCDEGRDRIWLKYGQLADFCKSGNEPSDSIKHWIFLD
jgi:hypothetical protein